jgi:hypothetical protein
MDLRPMYLFWDMPGNPWMESNYAARTSTCPIAWPGKAFAILLTQPEFRTNRPTISENEPLCGCELTHNQTVIRFRRCYCTRLCGANREKNLKKRRFFLNAGHNLIRRSDKTLKFLRNCNVHPDFGWRGPPFCPAHGRRNQ